MGGRRPEEGARVARCRGGRHITYILLFLSVGEINASEVGIGGLCCCFPPELGMTEGRWYPVNVVSKWLLRGVTWVMFEGIVDHPFHVREGKEGELTLEWFRNPSNRDYLKVGRLEGWELGLEAN